MKRGTMVLVLGIVAAVLLLPALLWENYFYIYRFHNTARKAHYWLNAAGALLSGRAVFAGPRLRRSASRFRRGDQIGWESRRSRLHGRDDERRTAPVPRPSRARQAGMADRCRNARHGRTRRFSRICALRSRDIHHVRTLPSAVLVGYVTRIGWRSCEGSRAACSFTLDAAPSLPHAPLDDQLSSADELRAHTSAPLPQFCHTWPHPTRL